MTGKPSSPVNGIGNHCVPTLPPPPSQKRPASDVSFQNASLALVRPRSLSIPTTKRAQVNDFSNSSTVPLKATRKAPPRPNGPPPLLPPLQDSLPPHPNRPALQPSHSAPELANADFSPSGSEASQTTSILSELPEAFKTYRSSLTTETPNVNVPDQSASSALPNGKRVSDTVSPEEFRKMVNKADSDLFLSDFQKNYANSLRISNPDTPDQQITEAVKRIEEFGSKSSNQTLDLSRLGLSELPKHKYLESLLSTQCKTLDLSGNRLLSKLPECVHNSLTLQELKINHTAIDFGKEMKRNDNKLFLQLKSLEATGTPTQKADYTKFKALERLKIGKLTKVEKISIPSSLKTLDASHCPKLSQIKGLENASHLKRLKLNGCKNLKKLHKESFKSDSLQKIDVSDTGMRDMPDLSLQKALKSVSVRGTKIPDYRLSSLKQTSVEMLDLSDNKKRKKFPDWIFSLKQLKSLDYSKTSLKTIPDALKELDHLKKLNVQHTSLVNLPHFIKAQVDKNANILTYQADYNNNNTQLDIQFTKTPVERRLLYFQEKNKSASFENINKINDLLHKRPSLLRRIFKLY